MKRQVGIILADENEFIPFSKWAKELGGFAYVKRYREYIRLETQKLIITAVKSGVGKVNAAAATAYLISDEKTEIILNAGLSGAISKVNRGDIVAGESYVECDFDLTAAGRPLGEKPDTTSAYSSDKTLLDLAQNIKGIKLVKMGTGDIFLTDRKRKQLYSKHFSINTFDMESAAIASVCHYAKVPFLSIRKVSDNAEDAALEEYREMDKRQEKDLTIIIEEILLQL